MRKQILFSLTAFGFVCLLGTAPAAAQAKLTATIPFTFETGGFEYSEGKYAVEHLNNNMVMKITNLTNGRAAMVLVPVVSGKPADGVSKLVFSQSTGHMKLNEIWFAGYPGMLTNSGAREASAKVVVVMK